jgi:MYXO-CTERM domain-containing protein
MRGIAPFLLVLALVLDARPARAQTTAQNLAKYHALRARLLKDFTVVGEAAGNSQPADVRDDGEKFIKWADSTIRLGWYLGVLATEHHLYAHPELYPGAAPLAPEATLTELHHALLALERIDRVADAAFPAPCTQKEAINGFFLRDDVPAGFHSHFPPTTTTYSDFVDPVLTNKEMSQDQVYHLLFGLALVKRFVAPGVIVQGRPLASWAVEQARRIMMHVVKDDWVIMNPACNRPVERGEAAGGYSSGSRLAIGFITDGAFLPDAPEALGNIWQLARSPDFTGYIDVDNRHMAMAIAAVGNGWADTTSEDLALIGEKPDWPLYALLHRALHGDAAVGWCRSGAAVNGRARAMLDELPAGADIASPFPGKAVHGFTRSNRFMRGAENAYTGENGSDGYRFNGLDYLLLHNLYALATPSTWEGGMGPGIPACPAPASPSDPSVATDEAHGGCGCRTSAADGASAKLWLLVLLVVGATIRRCAPRRA